MPKLRLICKKVYLDEDGRKYATDFKTVVVEIEEKEAWSINDFDVIGDEWIERAKNPHW